MSSNSWLEQEAYAHRSNEVVSNNDKIIFLLAGPWGDISSAVMLAARLAKEGKQVEVHFTEDEVGDAVKILQAAGVEAKQDLGRSVSEFVAKDPNYDGSSMQRMIETSTPITTNMNSGVNRTLAEYHKLPHEQKPMVVINALFATTGYHVFNVAWPQEKLVVVDATTAAPIWGDLGIMHGYLGKDIDGELSKSKLGQVIKGIGSPVLSALLHNVKSAEQLARLSHNIARMGVESGQGKALIASHQQDIRDLGLEEYIDPEIIPEGKGGLRNFAKAFRTVGRPHERKKGRLYTLGSVTTEGFEMSDEEREAQTAFREYAVHDEKPLVVVTFGTWGFLKDPVQAAAYFVDVARILPINMLIINTNMTAEQVQQLRMVLPNNVYLTEGKVDYPEWLTFADIIISHGGKGTVAAGAELQQADGKQLILGGDMEQMNNATMVPEHRLIAVRHRDELLEQELMQPGSFVRSMVKDLLRALDDPSMDTTYRKWHREKVYNNLPQIIEQWREKNNRPIEVMANAILELLANAS